MIPGGFGYEILRFENESIRDIAKLPADVRIIGALPDIPERHGSVPREWHHGAVPLRPVYILISHRYCYRVSLGECYVFTTLDEFLSRYAAFAVQEREPLPDDVEARLARGAMMSRDAWYRDAQGQLREYLWTGEKWVVK